MVEVRQRQVLAQDDRQVAVGAGRARSDTACGGSRGRLAVGGDIELEVARDAGRADDIGGHLAVGEGGDVEPDPQGKGDPDRVGIGKGKIVGLADDQRRRAVGGKNRRAARYQRADQRQIRRRGIVGLVKEHGDRQRIGRVGLDGELEDVGRQGGPLRHRDDEVLHAIGGQRVGVGDAVAKGDDRRRIAGGETEVKLPLQQLRSCWSPGPRGCPRFRASRRQRHPRRTGRRAAPPADSRARTALRSG